MTDSNRHVRGIQIEHLWVAIPFFAALWKGLTFPIPLLDFWWHLKMGEVIFESGSIPRIDMFSFTAYGKPFILQNWLSEIAYYLTYRAGGLESLVLLNALFLAATLVFIHFLCRQSTGNVRLSAFVTTLAAITFFGNARPQTFSFVLFAIFYWILDSYRFQRRNLLWMLPPLMALWVNLHGAFVMGLFLMGLFLTCESLRRLLCASGDETLSAKKLGTLFLVLVLSLAATLANPEILGVYKYVGTVVFDRASQLFVTEWQSPMVGTLEGWMIFFGMFFLCMLVFFYSNRKPGFTDLFLFLAFSIFALTAKRNTMWFSIIAPPILCRYLQSISFTGLTFTQRWPWLAGLKSTVLFKDAGGRARARMNLLIAAGLFLFLVLNSPWTRPALRKTSLWDTGTPVAAAEFMERKDIRGRVFHPQIYGDYLIWRLWPKQKSFIDGRVHLFGEDFVRAYLQILSDSNWERRLREYNIQYLLMSKTENDNLKIISDARSSPNWRLLYEDKVTALFESVTRPRDRTQETTAPDDRHQ